jgi:hypothetical protein
MFSLALLYLVFTITVYSAAYRVAGHYMMMRRVCARRVGCDHTRIDLGWISLVLLFRSSSLSPSPVFSYRLHRLRRLWRWRWGPLGLINELVDYVLMAVCSGIRDGCHPILRITITTNKTRDLDWK